MKSSNLLDELLDSNNIDDDKMNFSFTADNSSKTAPLDGHGVFTHSAAADDGFGEFGVGQEKMNGNVFQYKQETIPKPPLIRHNDSFSVEDSNNFQPKSHQMLDDELINACTPAVENSQKILVDTPAAKTE